MPKLSSISRRVTFRSVAMDRGTPRTLSGSPYTGLLLNSNQDYFIWDKIMGPPPNWGARGALPTPLVAYAVILDEGTEFFFCEALTFGY